MRSTRPHVIRAIPPVFLHPYRTVDVAFAAGKMFVRLLSTGRTVEAEAIPDLFRPARKAA